MLRSVNIETTLYPSWNATYGRYYFVVNVPVRYTCQLRGYLRHPDKASKLREPKCASGRIKTENLVTAVVEIPDGEVVDISLDNPHLYVPEGLTTHQTTNFLTGYGGGAFGLQTTLAEEQVYLDQEECENIIDAMFDTYPVLRKYIGIYKQFILEHGCAVSIFGRVRPLPEVESEDQQLVNKALRAGFNHLIQSTASDMMLLPMNVIDRTLFNEGLESCLVSTVHDSLVIDARISELPQVHDIVEGAINNLPEILDALLGPDYNSDWCRILPLTGDCDVGRNYHDQVKVDSFKDSSGEVDWKKAEEFLQSDYKAESSDLNGV